MSSRAELDGRPGNFPTVVQFSVFLGLLILAGYAAVLVGSRSFFFRDFGLFGYPLASYHRECFWRGEIPLWNPFNSCGLPFLAQWNTLVLYPGSLIYLLLPLPWSLNLFCLLHFFLAGGSMYLLARRWTGSGVAGAVAGAAFSFNGLTMNCLMWPNNIAALGWMPLVLLTAEDAWKLGGRRLIVAALCGAMQMLCGAPEIILVTWVAASLFLAAGAGGEGRRFLRFAGLVALVSVLCGAQLLPFLDLLAHSQRQDGTFAGDAWSMPPWGWLNLLVPLFRMEATPAGVFFQRSQNWTSSYYPGVITLGLALTVVFRRRPRVMVLSVLAVLGLWLSLGRAGGLYLVLVKSLPFLNFMRFPIKFVVLVTLALPLLAAVGCADLLAGRTIRRAFLVSSGAVVGLIAGTILLAWAVPGPGAGWAEILFNGGVRAALLIGFVFLLWRGGQRLAWLGAGAALLIWIDGSTHVPDQNPTVRPGVFEPGLLAQTGTPIPALGSYRFFLPREAYDIFQQHVLADPEKNYIGQRVGLFCDVNLLDRVPTIDGFYSLFPRESREAWSVAFFAPTNQSTGALLDFLSVRWIQDPGAVGRWQERPSARPVVTAGARPVFTDDPSGLLASNLSSVVLLPVAERSRVRVLEPSKATVEVGKFSAHRIEIVAEAQAPALVVLSQSFYHPWKVSIDGMPGKILRANHGFQAVEISAGRHQLEFTYRDRGFLLGLALSGLALLGCGVAWWRISD